MPQIPVNLGDVTDDYASLPLGRYLGQITKIKYHEPKKEGKFPQLQVVYTVIDEQALGKRQSEWISLSPNALFRVKRWFAKFGLGDLPELDVDDDTDELRNPDLYDIRVIFAVFEDPKDSTRIRTELESVEDDISAEVAGAPEPDPEPEAEAKPEADPEPVPAPRAAVAARPRPAAAAPAPAARPRAAAATQPQRRSLR